MTESGRPRVIRAELVLTPGVDPNAVGGAVTVALCGALKHDPPCHWPNNSAIDTTRSPAVFRTVFVASDDEAGEAEGRIVSALRSDAAWSVVSAGPGALTEDEDALGRRLARG